MTKTVTYTLVVALLTNCAHNLKHYRNYEKDRAIVIHARVGETIEPEEREQFGLFPGIGGFKSATFCGVADGGYEIRIVTTSRKLVAVNRDSLAIIILRDYIDRYEEIQNSKREFQEKWKIVDYDDLGLAITQHELNRIRKPGSGMMIGGGTGCLVGGVGFLALAEYIGEQADVDTEVGDLVFFSGWALSTATGMWLGEKIMRGSALKAIKESRKPRMVE